MHQTGDGDSRLPDLRFVPVESLVPHERHDEHRMEPLARRIREQRVLKNPPIVARLTTNSEPARYVVLDGANRSSAARAGGIPHIVVQLVRYEEPDVQLSTWVHALGEFTRADLEAGCAKIPGLECRASTAFEARALVARREALAWVLHEDGGVTTCHGGHDLRERNALLNALVDLYRSRGRIYRVTMPSLEAVRTRYAEVTSLVVFPRFEPAEVLELATRGERLPAGITRHLIRWRALRLNVPLERLADPKCPIEEKNRWLEEWLREKLSNRQVRFYQEPTVLFDE